MGDSTAPLYALSAAAVTRSLAEKEGYPFAPISLLASSVFLCLRQTVSKSSGETEMKEVRPAGSILGGSPQSGVVRAGCAKGNIKGLWQECRCSSTTKQEQGIIT